MLQFLTPKLNIFKSYENNIILKTSIILYWLTVLSILLRIKNIHLPMVYDEANTARFTDQLTSVFLYNSPGNHVFHTLLVYIFRTIFGMNELALRMPALLFGIATIPISFLFLSKYFNIRNVILVTGFLCLSDVLISYSVNARSYTMHIVYTFLIFYLIESAVGKNSNLILVIVCFISGLSMFTHPFLIQLYLISSCYGSIRLIDLNNWKINTKYVC